ncbi:DNA polymerase I [Treponema pectinovorum]|uniref:DNA polymerase I n=1 Tax=Treponema pectinovorum TaxID=164 RepID=UPI0011F3C806|nr:DNA polymerase I [Treponema pectinovorum]
MENFIDDKTVFILDSYGLIFREYYAFFSRPLTDSKGQNVSAIFGFFRNLSIILKTYKPKYFVAAMDSRTPTFRHQMYDKYKATRAKTPEDLKAQFPIIEECLKTLGIKPIRVDGFEADDVVATIAKQCDRQNRHCLILSADKDLQQLAGKNIHLLKPDKTKTWVEVDENGVALEWGVQPKKILDLLSLTGDSADNVPGVQGVGPKTAVKLIAEYETLENVLANADKIRGSLGEKLRTSKDEALLSKKLITLNEDVPLNKSEPALENEDLFKNFCTENLNFGDFAKEMTKRELPALAKTYSELKNSGGGSLPLAPAEPSSATPSAGHIPATPLLKKNQGKYNLCTDLKSLEDFVTQAINSKIVAFDTETDSLNTLEANLVGFSLSYKEGSGIYVPLIVNEGPLFMSQLISKKDAFDQLKKLFDSDITIAMHNAKFDLEILYSNGLDIINLENADSSYKLFDTMIAAWLLEPDRISKNPYSLETLSEQILGLKGTEFEEIVEKGKTFADVKLENAANYAAEDSDFTLKLCNYYQNALKKESLWDLYTQVEIKVLPILAKMELEGIHLDSKVLNNYGAELKTQIQKAENEIYETVGHEFNIASPKQLSTVLFQERALPPGKKTKTGYSTDTDVLESLCALDTVPQMILDYRAKSKLLSTYVETLPKMTDSHGRIHTTFMQTGTATGRLSSKDPNLQNIPVRSEEGRKIRSAFTAPQGKILISADYAQIELVVLAHLSGDKNLCRAFMQGVDVHKSTASLIYGVSMNEVSAEMRRNAKTLNFGLMYGMGAFSLAKDLSISRSEAANFIENYFKVYSGVKDFFDRNVALAEQTGYIQTLMGRKRWIRGINSKNRMEKESAIRIAKNSPIQGSAADIVKKAMIDVSSALNKSSTGAKLLLQVHDELILECNDDEKLIEETIALLTEKMESVIKLNVPLRVSVEKGKVWGEFH